MLRVANFKKQYFREYISCGRLTVFPIPYLSLLCKKTKTKTGAAECKAHLLCLGELLNYSSQCAVVRKQCIPFFMSSCFPHFDFARLFTSVMSCDAEFPAPIKCCVKNSFLWSGLNLLLCTFIENSQCCQFHNTRMSVLCILSSLCLSLYTVFNGGERVLQEKRSILCAWTEL